MHNFLEKLSQNIGAIKQLLSLTFRYKTIKFNLKNIATVYKRSLV